MAFRDSWHRALVYFGLAEEYHEGYEDDEPQDADLEDHYRLCAERTPPLRAPPAR